MEVQMKTSWLHHLGSCRRMITLDILLNILNTAVYWRLLPERLANGEGVGAGHGLGVSAEKCVGAPNIICEINASVTKGYH